MLFLCLIIVRRLKGRDVCLRQQGEEFLPIPVDLHTHLSVGLCVTTRRHINEMHARQRPGKESRAYFRGEKAERRRMRRTRLARVPRDLAAQSHFAYPLSLLLPECRFVVLLTAMSLSANARSVDPTPLTPLRPSSEGRSGEG